MLHFNNENNNTGCSLYKGLAGTLTFVIKPIINTQMQIVKVSIHNNHLLPPPEYKI